MEYEIKLSNLDSESLLEIIELLKITYPKNKKFSFEFLKWQYTNNPNGRAISFNAFFNNKLVAHYAVVPIFLLFSGSKIKGVLDINTATHPEHRGKKLFTTLAEETFNYLKKNDFEFVLGVANSNSTHGYLKYLGFKLISQLDVKIGFGKVQLKKEYECRTFWDEGLIDWRTKDPHSKYYIINDYIYSSNIVGYKIIVGCLSSNQLKRNLPIKLYFSPLNLYIGIGAVLPKYCYIDLPKFVKRPPFNLIVKDLKGNLPKISKENLLFQMIDFDVV